MLGASIYYNQQQVAWGNTIPKTGSTPERQSAAPQSTTRAPSWRSMLPLWHISSALCLSEGYGEHLSLSWYIRQRRTKTNGLWEVVRRRPGCMVPDHCRPLYPVPFGRIQWIREPSTIEALEKVSRSHYPISKVLS